MLSKKPTKFVKSALIVLAVGLVSSCFPWLTWGLAFGFPSVCLNTIVLLFIFRKELSSENSSN